MIAAGLGYFKLIDSNIVTMQYFLQQDGTVVILPNYKKVIGEYSATVSYMH